MKANCVHLERSFSVYRAGGHHFVYWRCQKCGQEWTVTEMAPDLGEPISADEVLEVHQQLESESGLNQLLGSE